MRPKAVFFDIDGTVYDFRTGVCDSTKEAIARLKRNGHYAVLCTGRSMCSIFDRELLDLDFDGIVAGCGTYVRRGDQLLLNYEIPQPRIEETLGLLEKYEMEPILEGETYLYYRREDYEKGREDPYLRTLQDNIPDSIAELERHRGDLHVNKISVRCCSEEKRAEGLALLGEHYQIMHVADSLKELVPKGYNKATGMQVICADMGVDKNDTYAFGDSGNDMDMLSYAGVGIAMGNAAREVREKADYITAGIREHGIYLGLKEFGLI